MAHRMSMFDLLLNDPEPESEPTRPGEDLTPASLVRLPGIHLTFADIFPGISDDYTLPILSDVSISLAPLESVRRIPRSRELDNLPGQSNLNFDQTGSAVASRGSGKKGLALSEVLNADSILDFDQPTPVPASKRKRSRGADDARKLPRPSSPRRQGSQRQQPQPLLPPLLAPLYEPPPNARLVPSINTETYGDGFGSSTFPHPRLGSPTVDEWPVTSAIQEDIFQPPFASSAETESVVGHAPTLEDPIQSMNEPIQAVHEVQPETSKCIEIPPSSPKHTGLPKAGKGKRQNRRWSEEETRDLLEGVTRYGIGSWKKILAQPDLHFHNRTAVDLKDRFRTCYPDQYLKRPKAAQKGSKPGDTSHQRLRVPPSLITNPTMELATTTATTSTTDPPPSLRDSDRVPAITFGKRPRRDRQNFTVAEDESLLKGFQKHKAKWNKIRADPDLRLGHRTRTDLRDRFRNRFTALFLEAGYSTTKVIRDDGEDGEGGEGNDDADDRGKKGKKSDLRHKRVGEEEGMLDLMRSSSSTQASKPQRQGIGTEETLDPTTLVTIINPPPPSQSDLPVLDPPPTTVSSTTSDSTDPTIALSLFTSEINSHRQQREDWITHLGQMDISSLLASEEEPISAPPQPLPPVSVIRMSDILNDTEDIV